MYKVIGKAFYQVNYNNQVFHKVRYTLQLGDQKLKGFSSVEGPLTETVCLSKNEVNCRPKIGDSVVVSYDVYNGVKKPNGIFII